MDAGFRIREFERRAATVVFERRGEPPLEGLGTVSKPAV
jgi:hypothetical protein